MDQEPTDIYFSKNIQARQRLVLIATGKHKQDKFKFKASLNYTEF